MYKTFILVFSFLAAAANVGAQTVPLAKSYKNTAEGNPISPCVFCADPTSFEYNGRLYLFGTNDHQQYNRNGKKGTNGYGNISSLVCLSTDDMVNWTFHGTIDVNKLCTWGNVLSWAPSAICRKNPSTGKDEFFIYFANGGGAVGVLKSNVGPTGPYFSPRNNNLISHGMAGVDPCNWLFDPGVTIDEDGQPWIAFGGGDPNNQGNALWPGNSRIAKLNKNSMTALDGAAVKTPCPYMFEASELNMIGGKYVLTFNTSWSDRNMWSQNTKRNGQPAPSTCSMCYLVTDTPMDPESWVYKGEYFPNEGNFGMGWGNNHTHLQKFQNAYYIFFHGTLLESAMKSAGAMGSNDGGYRSIAVAKMSVNESTQTITKASSSNVTKGGPAPIAKQNPYVLQQAETMATCGGIFYDDFTNIRKNTAKSTLGNDASENMQVKMDAGDWIMLRNVGFGNNGASRLTLSVKGSGKMEVRFGKTSKASAIVEFDSPTAFQEVSIDVPPTVFRSAHNVYFVLAEKSSSAMYFDAWQFTENAPTAVATVRSVSAATDAAYTLSGRRASHATRGMIIQNGQKHLRK